MSKTFAFDNQLALGQAGESIVRDAVNGILHDYNTHPHLQRSGIDITDDKHLIDVKTQAWKYVFSGNIPIEVFSVFEQQKPGWFYKSNADIVVWVYHDERADGLWHTGYVMPLTDSLREWVNHNRELWRRIEVANDGRYGEYTAINYLVPVPAFRPEQLIPFDTRTDNPSALA